VQQFRADLAPDSFFPNDSGIRDSSHAEHCRYGT
jgi:hypothetical protein